MNDDRSDNQDHRPDADNPVTGASEEHDDQTITIEIVRHRQVFDILHNPSALWKFLGLLMVVVVLLFLILATVSLIIKRYYPYNDINTNIYGATTLKNEDKDVTYWLFNTAEMWANSGIRVQENDILSIRTSGAWHTAIHHLVEDSKSNSILRDSWVGSEGGMKRSANDHFRAQFRISPNDIDGVLLMAVIPDKFQNGRETINESQENGYNKSFLSALDSCEFAIYRIGRERINVRVLSDGILHFTVNDIILTRPNIKKMYKRYINKLPFISDTDKDKIEKWVTNDWKEDGEIVMPAHIKEIDAKYAALTCSTNIKFGDYPGEEEASLLKNELVYYYEHDFCDAWYVDNIGSALVIIEHKHQFYQ